MWHGVQSAIRLVDIITISEGEGTYRQGEINTEIATVNYALNLVF